MTGPLPFIVAVTGHRDIAPDAIAPLSERVRGLLKRLRDGNPHTQIELLTPLAEGADRLAAHVALDLGIPIIAPLPLEPEEYKKDFADEASRQEFDVLRGRAVQSFVLPQPSGADPRPGCYVNVGAFVGQHCHVLIALWDGQETGKAGGTSEVVRFALEGPGPEHASYRRVLDPKDTGLVYHIVTPRAGAPRADAGQTRWLIPGGGEPEALRLLDQMIGCTDDFNRRAVDTSGGAAERRKTCEKYLVGTAAPISPALQRTASVFAIADDLAIRSQTVAHLAVKALFAVGFLTVVTFEAVTEDVDEAIVPYMVMLVVAYGLYQWVTSRGFDSKHLDYRSLAETLRVQFYWRLAGINTSVAEYYMRYHLKESEWIRKAIAAGDLHDGIITAPANGDPSGSGLASAIKEWVHGQNDFFTRAERRDHLRHRRIKQVAGAFALISFAAAIVFMVATLMGRYVIAAREMEQHVVVLVIAMLASGAAALHGYTEKQALEAQMKRYARMKGVFQSAIRALRRAAHDPARAREVLRELGKEALEENADWVMLHRDRPLEPPRGPGG